jgi:hypothetical protein
MRELDSITFVEGSCEGGTLFASLLGVSVGAGTAMCEASGDTVEFRARFHRRDAVEDGPGVLCNAANSSILRPCSYGNQQLPLESQL